MQDAFDLGASEFRDLSEISTAHHQQGPITDATPMNINVILITSNKVPAMEIVLPLLARRATIVLMTIQEEAITVPYMQFILPGHRMLASTEASRENHIKMLEFVQRHPEVRPWTEVFSMTPQGLEQAFKRLESGQMRYRGVLVNPCVLDGEGCANIRQRDN
jgi:D-arabinose 1-dehydrogenase-like Zn-dependent alcohol dehydrogenase